MPEHNRGRIARTRNLKQQAQMLGGDFLSVDLETCLTFAKSALAESKDRAKRERNRLNAIKGYNAILKLQKKIPEWPSGRDERKLQQLRSMLEQLGE